MENLAKRFFIRLSENPWLNHAAKKWGTHLAGRFIAGTDLPSVIETIKEMNRKGYHCTADHLGEFVRNRKEAYQATNEILNLLESVSIHQLDCHVSVKLSQLGLDIGYDVCLENMKKILAIAEEYGIFVNIDMEDYSRFHPTINILKRLRKQYAGVGTVIQSYLHCAEKALSELEDVRVRIVKGAYRENANVAFQSDEEIYHNFLKLAKKRLSSPAFTSIATHDHRIIRELTAFIQANKIPSERFDFQFLYGFREDLQKELLKEGYRITIYLPYGHEWFGYYMRRLAERPQNIQLLMKEMFYTEENRLKKGPVISGVVALSAFILYRKKRKKGNNP